MNKCICKHLKKCVEKNIHKQVITSAFMAVLLAIFPLPHIIAGTFPAESRYLHKSIWFQNINMYSTLKFFSQKSNSRKSKSGGAGFACSTTSTETQTLRKTPSNWGSFSCPCLCSFSLQYGTFAPRYSHPKNSAQWKIHVYIFRCAGSSAVIVPWERWAVSVGIVETSSAWSRQWPGFCSGAFPASPTSVSRQFSFATKRNGAGTLSSGSGTSRDFWRMRGSTCSFPLPSRFHPGRAPKTLKTMLTSQSDFFWSFDNIDNEEKNVVKIDQSDKIR